MLIISHKHLQSQLIICKYSLQWIPSYMVYNVWSYLLEVQSQWDLNDDVQHSSFFKILTETTKVTTALIKDIYAKYMKYVQALYIKEFKNHNTVMLFWLEKDSICISFQKLKIIKIIEYLEATVPLQSCKCTEEFSAHAASLHGLYLNIFQEFSF